MLATFVTFLMRGAARGSFADKVSTYRSEPDGARALYLLAEQEKLPVGRMQESLELLSERKNLALLAVQFSERNDKEAARAPWLAARDGGLDDDEDDDSKDDK